MEVNLKVIATYDVLLEDLERTILKLAKHHDLVSYALLQSVYGIGRIGALTILYEIENIKRFPGYRLRLLCPSGQMREDIRREELRYRRE